MDMVDGPSVGRIRRTSYGLYAAYWITDEIDTSANAAYVTSRSTGDFDREADPQNLELRLKRKVFETRRGPGAGSFLLSPPVKVPFSNCEDDAVTAIGDGQTDDRVRVVLHYPCDVGAFVSLETGYDKRAGLPRDGIPWNVTAGATLFEALTVSPFCSVVRSFGGPDIGDSGFSFPSVQVEQERLGVSASSVGAVVRL
jgi:hypothetical protein